MFQAHHRTGETGFASTCPTDSLILGVAAGTAPASEAFGNHLSACPVCQSAYLAARMDESHSLEFLCAIPVAMSLRPGDRLRDFQLLRALGKGSFGQVFLALDLVLHRQVALKITALDPGAGMSEARTLAALDHDSIVRVYSEAADAERKLRLLCMQYVDGADLSAVIRELSKRNLAPSGLRFLSAIDCAAPIQDDPDRGSDRTGAMAEQSPIEVVCALGAQIARALETAHVRGILHRDIKPANILCTRSGHPLLADFNLACSTGPDTLGSVGGTIAYMAPEVLDSLLHGTPPRAELRSDIYSLGVVLNELLGTGAQAVPHEPASPEALLERRRVHGIEVNAGTAPPELQPMIRRLLERSLASDPEERYVRAGQFAAELEGAQKLCRSHRRLREAVHIPSWMIKHPFAALVLLTFLPHVAACVQNIAYNYVQIVRTLSVTQQACFMKFMGVYNLFAWGTGVAVFLFLIAPIRKGYRKGFRGSLEPARKRALRLPPLLALVSALAWLPAGLLYPAAIDLFAGPIATAVYVHFAISFLISGLIATSYAVLGVKALVTCGFYPRLWSETLGYEQTARRELGPFRRRSWLPPLMAASVPIVGALALLGLAPDALQSTRVVLFMLLLFGILGLAVALWATERTREAIKFLTE